MPSIFSRLLFAPTSAQQQLRRFLLGAVILGTASVGQCANNQATDAAFAALFSMPGANPGWNIQAPQGFVARDEKALIGFLDKQRAAGADFNAYRHQGTLLHHAIRAKKRATAVWLLANGADPALTVRYPRDNAMALALRSGEQPLVKLLQDKYGMKPELPKETGPVAAPASPPDPEKQEVTNAIRKSVKSPKDLDAALAAIPEAVLRRQQASILSLFDAYGRAGWDPFAKTYIVGSKAAIWHVAWRRLPGPIDYSAQRELAARIPYTLWPELMASGYPAKDPSFALGCLLNDVPIDLLKRMWPALIANFPTFRQDAPSLVLAYYRIPGLYPCHTETVDLKAKLALLASEGMRTPVHGLSVIKMMRLKPDVVALLRQYLPSRREPVRVVDSQMDCTVNRSDAMYSELVRQAGNTVQAVAVPGEKECAFFIIEPPKFGSAGTLDGFYGPEPADNSNCPDERPTYRVLRELGGKVETIELGQITRTADAADALQPVRDIVSGKQYYLMPGPAEARCVVPELPMLLEWKGEAVKQTLAVVESADVNSAIARQCTDGVECSGIGLLSGKKQMKGAQTPMRFRTEDFLDKHWADRRSAYLNAAMALDRPQLKLLEDLGVPAHWTGEALVRVGKSQLPLEDKRKRIAKLFFDHKQLSAALSDEVLENLLAWLPAQDWRPIAEVAANHPDESMFAGLTEKLNRKGMQRIACDLDNARGLLCGERMPLQ